MTKPPLLPAWYKLCSITAIAAMLLLQLYYALGFSGFSIDGNDFSFKRGYERQLYEINGKHAFSVSHSSVAVVKVGDSFPLFRLCGACESRGSVLNLARYRKGSWVYTDMIFARGPIAYDTESGETFSLEAAPKKPGKVDPDDVPFYKEHGFTFDKEAIVDKEWVERKFKPLSTVHEMCTILQAAGFCILAIILLIGGVLLPIGLARRRRA